MLSNHIAGYVDEARELLWKIKSSEITGIMKSYAGKVPAPLTSQFENRASRSAAIEKKTCRLSMANTLFPSGKLDQFAVLP